MTTPSPFVLAKCFWHLTADDNIIATNYTLLILQLFYARVCIFKQLSGQFCSQGVIFGKCFRISDSTRWLTIFKLNHTSYVTSLSMDDYCCDVRKFWL